MYLMLYNINTNNTNINISISTKLMEESDVYEGLVYITSKIVTVAIFIISWAIRTAQLCYATYPEITLIMMSFVGIYMAYRMSVRIVKSYFNMVWLMVKAVMFLVAVITCLVIYVRGSNFLDHDVPYLQGLLQSYQHLSISDVIRNEMNNYMFKSFMGQFGGNYETEGGGTRGGTRDGTSARSRAGTGSRAGTRSNTRSKKSKTNKKSNRKPKSATNENLGQKFQKDAKKVLNEYGIEVDDDYLNYMNEHFNGEDDSGNTGGFGEQFMNQLGDTLDGFGIDMNQMNDFIGRFNG